MARPLKLIDLFCGAGGLSVGFEWLSEFPFESVWANDCNRHATDTYNANFRGVCTAGDIVDLLADPYVQVPAADLVIGGPPCQGFSLLNKKRTDDPRKKLWIPFLDVVDRSGARTFVMENVPQLLGSLEHEEVASWAAERGFRVWSGLLIAADYGVPQTRKRAFVVGSMDHDPAVFFPPKRTHRDPRAVPADRTAAHPWRTVHDAIGDLPAPVGTEIRSTEAPLDLHFGRNPTDLSRARYHAIPKEGMNRFDLQKRAPELTPRCWTNKPSGGTDLFGRLWWGRPAFTIRTEFFKPEKGRYLHPEQHRPITHREAARFQTFPDDFTFTGSKIEIAKQIGNAVPPVLAKAVADQIYRMWADVHNGPVDGRIPGNKTARDHVPSEEPQYASGTAGAVAPSPTGV